MPLLREEEVDEEDPDDVVPEARSIAEAVELPDDEPGAAAPKENVAPLEGALLAAVPDAIPPDYAHLTLCTGQKDTDALVS